MDFDDMKAKADAEAGKLEQEGEQKAKQEFDKEAPQYEQKAKTDADEDRTAHCLKLPRPPATRARLREREFPGGVTHALQQGLEQGTRASERIRL